MSKAMSFEQLQELFKYIRENNSPYSGHRKDHDGKWLPIVKYADPVIDFRTNECFHITLRGFGWNKAFATTNEFRDLPQSLYDRVMQFLNNTHTESVTSDQAKNQD